MLIVKMSINGICRYSVKTELEMSLGCSDCGRGVRDGSDGVEPEIHKCIHFIN